MCRIAGAFNVDGAADITRRMLQAQQHGGQEGAGICSEQGGRLFVHRGFGLVDEVFNPVDFDKTLPGRSAIGHVRYATTGESRRADNLHPFLAETLAGTVAVAHNGNLTNYDALRDRILRGGAVLRSDSDTELIMCLLGNGGTRTLTSRLLHMYGQIEGSATVLALTPGMLCAGTDPYRWRPLVFASYKGGFLLASETRALELYGIRRWHTLRPGTVLELTEQGATLHEYATIPIERGCSFEHVYFAMPDSEIFGDHVGEHRRNLGRALAARMPKGLDVIIAVPNSALVAAQAVAQASGVPVDIGLVRNPYSGRTFTTPTQPARELGVRMKLNVDRTVVEGRRVGLVDDSIVRGTTMRQIARLLKDAGAKEVHLLVSSPPVTHPCHWGIDTPSRKDLIAARVPLEQLPGELGVDSITFLTEEDLLNGLNDPFGERHCTYCFTGRKPVPHHLLPGETKKPGPA